MLVFLYLCNRLKENTTLTDVSIYPRASMKRMTTHSGLQKMIMTLYMAHQPYLTYLTIVMVSRLPLFSFFLSSTSFNSWFVICYVNAGRPLNLYRDQMMCLHYGRSNGGDRDQCINPEGLASFLGFLESLPSHTIEPNQESYEPTSPNTRYCFVLYLLFGYLV